MVELLLKNKSPLNASDIAGQTPLHHAIAEGHGKHSYSMPVLGFVFWIGIRIVLMVRIR